MRLPPLLPPKCLFCDRFILPWEKRGVRRRIYFHTQCLRENIRIIRSAYGDGTEPRLKL